MKTLTKLFTILVATFAFISALPIPSSRPGTNLGKVFLEDTSFELSNINDTNPYWPQMHTRHIQLFCRRDVCGTHGPGPHTGEWYLWLDGRSRETSGIITQDFITRECTDSMWLVFYITGQTTKGTELHIRLNDHTINIPEESYNTYWYTLKSYIIKPRCGLNVFSFHYKVIEGDNIFIDDVAIIGCNSC